MKTMFHIIDHSLYEVQKWWEVECNIGHTDVFKDAKKPMYSLWYSYH